MTPEQQKRDLEITQAAFAACVKSAESAEKQATALKCYARVQKLLEEEWERHQRYSLRPQIV
jgi:hypothetical protein